ncbi:MAG: DUF6370 family protein [Ferruginibacter sp.]
MFASAQSTAKNISIPDPAQKIQKVEMACGQCRFHLKGKGCKLAVKINGKAYFVDGAGIDDFGNAHQKDGFCKAIGMAKVQGKIINNRFIATYIKVLKPVGK